jgi:hypothetical protein
MIEDQVRALFTGIADGEPTPSRVDIGLAHRRGRARLRWRRAGLAGAPVLAAAAVAAVALAVGAAPSRPGPGPALVAPAAAPRQFNPLAPYAAFGWLPSGNPVLIGGSSQSLAFQVAGPGMAQRPWMLDVAAAGYCRLAPAARALTCRVAPRSPSQTWRITAPAPPVLGHLAFWAHTGGESQGYLVWRYARGGWAVLTKVSPGPPSPAWRALALKVAVRVRYGAHAAPPLAFPLLLFGVPAAWRVGAVSYVPHGAVSQASEYTLAAGQSVIYPSGLSQPGLPGVTIARAGVHSSCPSMPHSAREVVAGYHVVVGHVPQGSHTAPQEAEELLCAANADGLVVNIKVLGQHPVLGVVSLFAHHMLLLGPHPARWAHVPIALPARLGP